MAGQGLDSVLTPVYKGEAYIFRLPKGQYLVWPDGGGELPPAQLKPERGFWKRVRNISVCACSWSILLFGAFAG